MSLSDPPDIVVPLSAWGYVGFTALGLLALAALVVAALLYPVSSRGGLGVAGVGALVFMPVAFAYLRTVEMGWQWPNLAVWAGLLGSGILAAVVVHVVSGRLNLASSDSVWIIPGGVAVGTLIAAVFDALNELLGSIPLSWGAAFLIVALAVVLVLDRR